MVVKGGCLQMNKYVVIGFTKEEAATGYGLKLLKITSSLFENFQVVAAELGNVINYGIGNTEVSDEFKAKFGDYFNYEFIKESVFPIIEKQMKLRTLGVINEKDIPKQSAILTKL
jgi:hypothetical protein